MALKRIWKASVALVTCASVLSSTAYPAWADATRPAVANGIEPPALARRTDTVSELSSHTLEQGTSVLAPGATPKFADSPQPANVSRTTISPGSVANLPDVQKVFPSDGRANEGPEQNPPSRTLVGEQAVLGGSTKTGVSGQSISVPKGAGKIDGLGESFTAQPSTGVAMFTVPLKLPAPRGRLELGLSLSYSSGSGAGIAGMGWDLAWPAISRQTDRALPKYDDQADWHPRQDRFVFGGVELVPIGVIHNGSCVTPNGACQYVEGEQFPASVEGWQYFRARIEGSFLRFFWKSDHKSWLVQGKDGSTIELGVSVADPAETSALEVDPGNPSHIFRWNIVREYDAQRDAGNLPVNIVQYRYESNGEVAYLKDIYASPPVAGAASASLASYAHHVRLSYEQRPDPTFSFRRGWRVDHARRLARVDVTSMPFSGGEVRRQVRRYAISYDPSMHVSLLESVTLEGRCGSSDEAAPAEDASGALPWATTCATLPPMRFGYEHVAPYKANGAPGVADLQGYEGFDERVVAMTGSPSHSLDDQLTDLFDINGDSLPDVVTTQPGSDQKYPLFLNGGTAPNGFATSKLCLAGVMGATPTDIRLSNDNVAASDLDGDGIIDWLHQPQVKKFAVYSPRSVAGCWTMVGRAIPTASAQSPQLDLTKDNPEVRVMDVDQDGLVDVVRSTGTQLQTFFSLGRLPGGDGQFGSGKWTGPASATLNLTAVPSCVPLVTPGVPIRFSDRTTKIADMNGDGLPDIVYVQQGDVRYWPGRGDGSWGTGQLGTCASGFVSGSYISMASSPWYSDPNGGGVRLDDVNGDGLDDLVQVRFDAVDIWLNVDGVGFTGNRHVVTGFTPAAGPLAINRVRLVDVNGSGTRDLLWGEGGNYRYMDLAGGKRPWLLTRVDNSLGKTTELEYTTSARAMLDAAAEGRPWDTKVPVVQHMIKRVTERDNLTVAEGAPAYVTEYTYRDPVFDGRQREFRGFRFASMRQVGDLNSPTSTTTTEFLLGECEDEDDEPPGGGATSRCSPDGRWADNVREALKGLPVITETSDEQGIVYLSTTHTTYRLRKLAVGRDGRQVRHAFAVQTDTWHYDTSDPAAFAAPKPTTMSDVERQAVLGSPRPERQRSIMLRTIGAVHVQSDRTVDVAGNVTEEIAWGRKGIDEKLTTYTSPTLLGSSGWLFRTAETYVTGSNDTAKRVWTNIEYDQAGNPIHESSYLEGTLALERWHSSGAQTAGNIVAGASHDGWIDVSWSSYDEAGNLISNAGPGGRCRELAYESTYADFAVRERIFAGALTAGGATCLAGDRPRGAVALESTVEYDRSVAAPRMVRGNGDEVTTIAYDDFGRIVALTAPDPTTPGASSPYPSLLVDYDVATPARPFSIVRTRTVHSDAPLSYRESYAYVDGMARVRLTLEEADRSARDEGDFIVRGLERFDAKGAVQDTFLPWFWDGDPRAYPISAPPPTPHRSARYDAFGRPIEQRGYDGLVEQALVHHALSTDTWDAADLAGEHAETYATSEKDGHGRVVKTTARIRQRAALEQHHVLTTYTSTGQPTIIRRTRAASDDVVRWVRYDTLGRMVLNVEPNTSTGAPGAAPAPSPSAPVPSGLHALRYAFDDSGDLVGTSDARGCGVNYAYDSAGRILAEDYSPCVDGQPPYTAPDLATGSGTEAFYRYDTPDPAVPASIDDCTPNPAMLHGRLASISDRGSRTVTGYDVRGRVTCVARQIARPGRPATDLASRYAPRFYTQATTYDAADREIDASTGAQVVLPEGASQSAITITYSKRGVVASVGSTYGALVNSIKRDADGLTTETRFGDAAGTTTALSYDEQRRLVWIQTYRGTPPIWSATPPAYSPAPPLYGPPTSLQLLLQDFEIEYDAVDNPIEIKDNRLEWEWPAGAKPASRSIKYDDLYRVKRVDYSYAGDAAWVSPYAAENTSGVADNRQAEPSPHVAFDNRIAQQTFAFDWLGNTVQTGDDAAGFYDRSLGTVTNGVGSGKPYQLLNASNEASGSSRSGRANAAYDRAGNVTGLLVVRNGPCLPAGASCTQRFAYDWDETSRLVRARRWDLASADGQTASGPLPATAAAVDLRYAYDADDMRVLKTAADTTAGATFDDAARGGRQTVYVFDSLEVRGAGWVGTRESADYELSVWTEVPYLLADNVRLGRVHYDTEGLPASSFLQARVYLEVPDHLGSTNIVFDRETGELVETATHTAQGTTESDYRPGRWKAFREDYRFTEKEEDIEVGLTYVGNRFLHGYLGRWMSPDPLAIHAPGHEDLNVYAYVHGKYLAAVDPDGMQTRPPRVTIPVQRSTPLIVVRPEPPRIRTSRWVTLGVQNMPQEIRSRRELPKIPTIVVRGPFSPRGGYVIRPHRQQISPKVDENGTELESHHGVLTEMAKSMVYRYSEGAAPTILMTKEQHRQTVKLWETQKPELMRRGVLPSRQTPKGATVVDWSRVSPEMKRALSESIMSNIRTPVPKEVQTRYFETFEVYRQNQEAQRAFDEFDMAMSRWKQSVQEIRPLPPRGE